MLVTDDKHPGDLIQLGHIDYILRKAIHSGADPIRAIKMATKQPAEYFGLRNVGAIAPGYKADLVILNDLQNIEVAAVYKGGMLVAQDSKLTKMNNKLKPENDDEQLKVTDQIGILKIEKSFQKVYHSFHMSELLPEDFIVLEKGKFMRVIELIPGELLTKELVLPNIDSGVDLQQDIIKLAVVERHHNTGHIGLGFLKGYGMRNGAIASSIAHDSHNLIVVGTTDEDMCLAANSVRKNQGGIAVVSDGQILGELPLPIAGLMCNEKAEYVENILSAMKNEAQTLGVSTGIDPFMTLAFISLPVIPEIRLTTLGLVDVKNQQLIKTIY